MGDKVTEVKNYTDQMVAKMTMVYEANPTRATAEAIADEFEKPVRSVIAKLSNLGIYKAQARMTKAGVPVVRKEQIVAQIQEKVGIEVPTLSKATKQDLQNLLAALAS